MKAFCLRILIILFFCIYPDLSLARSFSDQPQINHFRWSETATGFHCTAVLQRGFSSEIEDCIRAGVPATFHFFLKLKQMRWYWDNKVLSSQEYIHTVTYDTLRKVFTIEKYKLGNSEPFQETQTDDPSEMRRIMSSFEGDLKVSRWRITPEKQHYISLRTTLKTENLPPPWNILLFFISNDFDTETSRQFLPVITEDQ